MAFPQAFGYSYLPRTRRDYSEGMGQGLGNSIVLAVVGWATRNYPQAPHRIRLIRKEGKKLVYDDIPMADAGAGFMLKLLDYPNTFYSGVLLMQAILIDRITTANAYVAKVRNGSGRVVELWWLPSILVEPRWPGNDPGGFLRGKTDVNEYISYYEYNPNGLPYAIKPDDIIHFRDGLDPQNTRKGLNRLAKLAREIFTDDEASNFSATLLSNLGVPGVIISPENTGSAATNRLVDPEGIKDSYMEKFGGDKRGEPLVLTAPTKVQMLSWSPEQMGLKDLRRMPEERLTAALGLAAIVAGMGAGLDRSTFANMDEARQAAWEEFLIPMMQAMDADLRVQLLNEFADWVKYIVDHDLSEVRVLQEDQGALFTRWLAALSGGGVTRATFKERIGEDFDEKDNVYYIPAAVDVTNADEVPPLLSSEQDPVLDEFIPTIPPPTNGKGPVPAQV